MDLLPSVGRQQEDAPPLDDHGRERPAIGRPGVDGQPVSMMFNPGHGGVAMHDKWAMIARVIQEFMADPIKIARLLRIQRYAGAKACMDQQASILAVGVPRQ